MRHVQVILIAIVAALLSGCAVSSFEIDPPENLVGTWVEPMRGGEAIFRADGTVTWFGAEGTHVTVERRELTNIDVVRGWRLNRYTTVTLPNHTFVVRPNAKDDVWAYIRFRDAAAVSASDSPGPLYEDGFVRANYDFRLFRTEASIQPIYSAPFEERTLSIPGETLLRQNRQVFMAANQLYTFESPTDSMGTGGVYRYDAAGDTWVELDHPENSAPFRGAEALTANDQLMLTDRRQYSLDAGTTWQDAPDSSVFWPDASLRGPNIIRSSTRYRDVEHEDGFIDRVFEHQDISILDTSVDTPSWQLRHSFSREGTLVDSTSGPLVYQLQDDTSEVMFSLDLAQTWTTLVHPCGASVITSVEGRIVCIVSSESSNTLHHYDIHADTWTAESVSFTQDRVVKWSNDVLYVADQGGLFTWTFDGLQTLVVPVEGPASLPVRESDLFAPIFFDSQDDIHVLDNEVYVSHFGLWRAEF